MHSGSRDLQGRCYPDLAFRVPQKETLGHAISPIGGDILLARDPLQMALVVGCDPMPDHRLFVPVLKDIFRATVTPRVRKCPALQLGASILEYAPSVRSEAHQQEKAAKAQEPTCQVVPTTIARAKHAPTNMALPVADVGRRPRTGMTRPTFCANIVLVWSFLFTPSGR